MNQIDWNTKPTDDELIIQDDGEWSIYKHYYLKRYIDAFTTSMKDKWKLHYIDLFAGAGIKRIKETGQLEWSSAMIAALTRYPFNHLHLCDKDSEKLKALQKRVLSQTQNATFYHGDANQEIQNIVKSIPQGSLSLAFLDPYGLHLEFETLRLLKHHRTDLIIFFPDRLDIIRNWFCYYLENPDSNLDKYLGPDSGWREKVDKTAHDKLPEVFRDIYIEQLRTHLGYEYFDPKRISGPQGPLYQLLFCSREKIALQLWNNISLKEPDGQRTFNW